MKKITLTKEQQKQVMLGVVIVAAFGYVYFKFLISPVSQNKEAKSQELQQLSEKLRVAKDRAQRLPELQRDLAALEIEIKSTESQLPTTKQLPDMLRFVTKTAVANRVAISRFEPRPAQPSPNGYFNQLPFGLTISGSYHDLAKFLTDMGQSVRIITPNQLQLTGKSSTDNKQITVDATFDLIAYVYKG